MILNLNVTVCTDVPQQRQPTANIYCSFLGRSRVNLPCGDGTTLGKPD